ncbi:MAG: hypothetical protein IPF75_00010 [Bacteroidetes bacterium]|nr:hypothetical protein [Bacteroidota bacterium]
MNQSADLLLEIQQLREENLYQRSQIQKLQHQLEQLLRSQFGSKSEKYEAPSGQIALGFNLPPWLSKRKKRNHFL